MSIQPTTAYSAASFIANSTQQRRTFLSVTANPTASSASLADKTTISQSARDRIAEETKAGGTHDFTNMSPNDMLDTINGLIKSGQMTVDETSSLMMLIPIALGGSDIPAAAAANQKVNLFSALENMIAYDKSTHNEAAVIYHQKAISALERFQGAHRAEG